VRFGKTLVVSDVDEVEALLYPLLRRDLVHSGPRYAVQLGDKLVDYNEAFRLYLITRNPAITIPPDAAPLLAVTNFTVTRSGMESQLLGLTIKREQPELEHQKSALLKQEEELKVELAALERSLLQSLATSKGNLLENKELLDSLNETKAKSNTITTSLDESHRLQITLDEQRNAYAPIAQRGSTMYFLVRDLAAINHMYQVTPPST
jgi:dynein heavy chain 2